MFLFFSGMTYECYYDFALDKTFKWGKVGSLQIHFLQAYL